VLAAWLSAFRANGATAVLRECVRRFGIDLVHCVEWYESRGLRLGMRSLVGEVIHREYILVSHEPCWGGMQHDVVWRAFCTSPREEEQICDSEAEQSVSIQCDRSNETHAEREGGSSRS